MKVVFNAVQIVCLLIVLQGCSKDDAAPSSRMVKYDVSGNYTGKVTIVYSSGTGSFETIANVTLPWSKNLNINNDVPAATINISTTSTSTVGLQGQTATIKILINNEVKQTGMGTADASGRIQIPSVVHYF